MTELLPATGSILERAGVTVTPVSLTVTDPAMPFEVMAELVGFISEVEEGAFWWMGDALNAAETMYGEVFSQLEAASGLSERTLYNRASVARNLPPERRRRGINPSVHAEVAYLEPREQKRLLDKAEQELASGHKMTKSEMRDEVREVRGVIPVETCRCDTCGHEHRKPSS